MSESEGSHGIDLAPMLDFVLNLLIFFIITAVFVKESGLLVNRPGGAVTAGGNDASSVSLQILASGEVLFEDRVIDIRAIRANVERIHAVSPTKGVMIIAEREAPSGYVVQAIDQIHLGGVYNITFATGQ